MTLGTNATLDERLKYAPDEITPNDIAEMFDELAAWKELLSNKFDGPDDIKARLEELEDEVTLKDRETGALEFENAKLKARLEELEDEVTLKDRETGALEFENAKLKSKINNLENLIEELEDQF